MTSDKGIFIKNIYYMLAYAFQILRQENYEKIAAEEFEEAQDLFAAILASGVARQLKQGLYREYVTKQDSLLVLRGKIDMQGTMRNLLQKKQSVACEFDELSEDNPLNRILKTTMQILVRDKGVSQEHKNALKRELVFFDGISTVAPGLIRWDMLRYDRNNKNYELLMNICFFVIDGMLETTERGEYRMAAFSDEHMARLYERFILEYYRRHYAYLDEVKAAEVKWNLGEKQDESMIRFLPAMQTDIYLRRGEKVLILDAKYYGKTLQTQFNKSTLHSGNLYQIFTYVKNEDRNNTGNVSGMLVYAKTDEEITPDCRFDMGGNEIGAVTLDLNRDFVEIAAQLNRLANRYFA